MNTKVEEMTAKDQGLPELPEPAFEISDWAGGERVKEPTKPYFSAAQMRAYALAALAALASDTGERVERVNPEIIGNPDAAAWADCFAKALPNSTIGRDVMVGWFANAMMAAHDHALAKPVKITPDILAAVAGYYHDGPVRNWDVVRAIESSIADLTQPQPAAPPESGGQGEVNYARLQEVAAEFGLNYNVFCAAFRAATTGRALAQGGGNER